MYLEIDEGYFEHPKTLALCAALEDHNALVYPLRLWKWACRSAKSGQLGNISPFALEKVVEYEPMDGKCFKAMVDVGFIDKLQVGFAIHDWMQYTGGAIEKMAKKAADNKDRRDKAAKAAADAAAKRAAEMAAKGQAKGQTDAGSMPELASHPPISDPVEIPPRQGKARPDQARQEEKGSPSAGQGRNPSGYELVNLFGRVRCQVFPNTLPWSTARDAKGDAASFAALLRPEDIADIEPSMLLALQHIRDGIKGWADPRLATNPSFAFGAWKSGFHALREELHRKAPPRPGSLEAKPPAAPVGPRWEKKGDFKAEAEADGLPTQKVRELTSMLATQLAVPSEKGKNGNG